MKLARPSLIYIFLFSDHSWDHKSTCGFIDPLRFYMYFVFWVVASSLLNIYSNQCVAAATKRKSESETSKRRHAQRNGEALKKGVGGLWQRSSTHSLHSCTGGMCTCEDTDSVLGLFDLTCAVFLIRTNASWHKNCFGYRPTVNITSNTRLCYFVKPLLHSECVPLR